MNHVWRRGLLPRLGWYLGKGYLNLELKTISKACPIKSTGK